MDKYSELEFLKIVGRVIKTQVYGVEYITFNADKPPFCITVKLKDVNKEFRLTIAKNN